MANIERIQKWHDALLSGEYEQTRGALRDDEGFCCLGVACDISEVSEWKLLKSCQPYRYSYYYDDNRSLIPGAVEEWLDIPDETTEYAVGNLISLNDGGYDFKTIAAKIRYFWPEVKFNG